MIKTIVTDSPLGTIEIGRKIGSQLRGGEVFSLIGDLGTGKTHFIKGIAMGLNPDDPDGIYAVNSPTFVLVNEYLDGRLDVYHIDAYRLDSIREFENLGFDDLCYPGSVVLIEWADKVASALSNVDTLQVELRHESENHRQIEFKNLPEHIHI